MSNTRETFNFELTFSGANGAEQFFSRGGELDREFFEFPSSSTRSTILNWKDSGFDAADDATVDVTYRLDEDVNGNLQIDLFNFRYSGIDASAFEKLSLSSDQAIITNLVDIEKVEVDTSASVGNNLIIFDSFFFDSAVREAKITTGSGDDEIYVLSRNEVSILDGVARYDFDGGAGDDIVQIESNGNVEAAVKGGSGDDYIELRGVTVGEFSYPFDVVKENLIAYGGAGDDQISAANGNNYLSGGNGDDQITSGTGDDLILGGRGDDNIFSEGGNNRIFGHAGDDQIQTGFGDDVIYGGSGDDRIFSQGGDNIIRGGAGDDGIEAGIGNDTLYGNSGQDFLFGGAGNDRLYGGADDDQLRGGEDSDLLFGGNGEDVLLGEEGNDRLYGQNGDDNFQGGDGNDRIYGGNGEDRVDGDAGNDRIYGQNGDDRLNGGEGTDYIRGGQGVDIIRGESDGDRLYGDKGNDALIGGEGRDRIYGGAGDDYIEGDDFFVLEDFGNDDRLYGGSGNDFIIGGAGDDRIYGGSGDDQIIAGAGRDTLFGNAGADSFRWDVNFEGVIDNDTDSIKDFSLSQGDVLDFSVYVSTATLVSDIQSAINDFIKFTEYGDDTVVSVDADGGGDSFVEVVQLSGVTGLSQDDQIQAIGGEALV